MHGEFPGWHCYALADAAVISHFLGIGCGLESKAAQDSLNFIESANFWPSPRIQGRYASCLRVGLY